MFRSPLLLLCISCAIGLGLAEFLVRAAPRSLAVQFDLRWATEVDPVRGWRNVPGAGVRLTTREYSHEVSYNARGYRGALRPFEKPSGTRRIVMLGDSFVDGYSVAVEARVSEQLDATMQAAGVRTETIALGKSGYGTDQEMLWLRDEGWRYRPDLVVVMFYMNDVWDNGQALQQNAWKPSFTVENGRLVPRAPVPAATPTATPAAGSESVEDWLDAHSRAYALAKSAISSNPGLRRIAERFGLLWPEDPHWALRAGIRGELQAYARHPSPEFERRWQVTAALLNAIAEDCTAHGVPLLVFAIPARIAVEHEEWADAQRILSLDPSEWDTAEVNRRLAAICAAQQLTCLDPQANFEATPGPLYYRLDAHWNAAGHRLAAATIGRWILSTRPGAFGS